jgi:predicted MPP superfamily phosphohydrolase
MPRADTDDTNGIGGDQSVGAHGREWYRTLRKALLVAVTLTGVMAWVRFIGEPLHERGIMQTPLGIFNGIACVMGFPGFAAVGVLNPRQVHHISGGQWWASLAWNIGLYAAALFLLQWWQIWWRGREGRRSIMAMPATMPCAAATSRRQFFRHSARMVVTGGLLGTFGYSLAVEPRNLRVHRRKLALRDLPPELAGLRLVQVSDVHHGPWLSLDYVRSVVKTTNALNPDVILLTGDYVYESWRYVAPVAEVLGGLRARIGTLAVLGNHDWYEGGRCVLQEFARNNLPLIDNSRVFIKPDRTLVKHTGEGLCIAGVGDLWEGSPNYSAALSGLPRAMPRLLLSHNPDAAEDVNLVTAGYRVDLMISGHTHGGQVWIPGVGTPIVPSKFGQKYASGLVKGPACDVFVSKGVGVSGLPVRFGVPPEVVVFELAAG